MYGNHPVRVVDSCSLGLAAAGFRQSCSVKPIRDNGQRRRRTDITGQPKGTRTMSLTPKQAKFVSEYLVDLNATAAAGRNVGIRTHIGRQLITKNNVAAAIDEERKKVAAKWS